MIYCPTTYNKSEFLNFLKNEYNDVIDNFSLLPEQLMRNSDVFKLNVNTIFYGIGDERNVFEMNYYSDEIVEFLFNLKTFNNPKRSIDYLIYEIAKKKL